MIQSCCNLNNAYLELFVQLFKFFILIRVTLWELVHLDSKLIDFISYLKVINVSNNVNLYFLNL